MQVLDWAELNELSRDMMFVDGFVDFMFKTVQSNIQHFQLTEVSHQHPSIIFTQYLTSEQLPFHLIWTLRRKQNWSYQFQVRPEYLQRHGTTLKADNHSTVIEFLELITGLNTQQKYWTAFISASDQLNLKYTLQPKPFISSPYKNWWRQLRNSALYFYQKIVIILEPYSLEPQESSQQVINSQVQKNKDDDGITKIYLDMLQYQIRRKTQLLVKEDSNQSLRQLMKIRQITHKSGEVVRKEKQSILKQHQQSFRILGIQQPLSWNMKQIPTADFFKKKEPTSKVQSLNKEMKFRNVQAIKNIKPLFKNKTIEEGDSSHCSIRVGIFNVELLDSISPQTNKAFEEQKKIEEKKQIQRQLELVLKTPEDKCSEAILNSFKNEIKFIKHIRNSFGCQNIASFYLEQDKRQREEKKYFLMNYYPTTLQEFNMKGNGSVLAKIEVLYELAQGLQWLQHMGICHRDIKPLNIMIDFSKKVKIIDFGGCCPQIINERQAGGFEAESNRFLGTYSYYSDFKKYNMLPLADKHSKDAYRQHPAFDVYSFGKVMQETLSPDLEKLKDIGEFLKYIWTRCLSIVPQDRPSFHILVNILSRVARCYSSRTIIFKK